MAAEEAVEVAADAAEIVPEIEKTTLMEEKAMMATGYRNRVVSLPKRCASLLISVLFIALTAGQALAAEPKQKTFASPEEAVKALVDASKAGDTKALSALFGPKGKDLVFSGDPVADKAGRERFVALYEQKQKLEEVGADKVILHRGKRGLAIPRSGGQETGLLEI